MLREIQVAQHAFRAVRAAARQVSELAEEIPSLRQSILTALTNVTSSHLLDNELYDFRNFEPLIKKIPAGHGSVEKELDAVFDHSEPQFMPLAIGNNVREAILASE
ncbi:hypothetical protein J4558_23430 [Leptolyngbya sp. 15MV]|nr:hypothetical protein J4558_23430 [Leptolyngbya sp. 15MV]